MNNERAKHLIIGMGPSGLSVGHVLTDLGFKYDFIEKGLHYGVSLNNKTQKKLFEEQIGGIGGYSRLWGAQNAFPDEYVIDKFINKFSASSSLKSNLLKELDNLANVFQISLDTSNLYENLFEQEISNKYQIQTVHSIYLKSKILINYFKIDLSLKHSNQVEKLNFFDGFVSEIIFSNGESISINKEQNIYLCAGAFETTRIYLNSINKSYQKSKIKDHPSGYILSFQGKNIKGIYRGAEKFIKGTKYKRKFLIEDQVNERAGIVEFHYDYLGKLVLPPLKSQNFYQKIQNYINVITIKLFKKHLFSPRRTHVWIQINQKFDDRNYFEYIDGKFNWNWDLVDDDLNFIDYIKERVRKFLEENGQKIIWQLEDPTREFCDAYHPSGSLYYQVGTDLPPVDIYGRTPSAKNLYICSTATWPTASWFNPTFFLMAHSAFIARNSVKMMNSI